MPLATGCLAWGVWLGWLFSWLGVAWPLFALTYLRTPDQKIAVDQKFEVGQKMQVDICQWTPPVSQGGQKQEASSGPDQKMVDQVKVKGSK